MKSNTETQTDDKDAATFAEEIKAKVQAYRASHDSMMMKARLAASILEAPETQGHPPLYPMYVV